MSTIGALLLIHLMKVSLQPFLLQYNYRAPPAQLIWVTIISIFIRMLRLNKYNRIVIQQKTDPSPNVTKERENFLTPGNDYMVQHTSPNNKSIPQDIFILDIEYAHKKSCIIYSP